MSGWRHTVARDEIRDVLVILSFVMVTMMANVVMVIDLFDPLKPFHRLTNGP